MPLFYYYTDDAEAINIIRIGRVLASREFVSGGDTANGNGVYLTQLKPETSSQSEIAMNNWMDTSEEFLKKTENCFVFDIPESDVKDSKAQDRNIFLFGYKNDLRLQKYPWWLKAAKTNKQTGEIIASYKYKIMSLGPAAILYRAGMGNYAITEERVNGRPVYEGSSGYLYMASNGDWLVGPVAGGDEGWFSQRGCNYSLGPDNYKSWWYMDPDKDKCWLKDDLTLKAFAWQM